MTVTFAKEFYLFDGNAHNDKMYLAVACVNQVITLPCGIPRFEKLAGASDLKFSDKGAMKIIDYGINIENFQKE